MTAEALKALLSQPLSLFILMLFGSIISMFKQLLDARTNNSTITLGNYFFRVETAIMIGANIIAFVALIMTDTLNWTGAIGIGYVMNSIADLKPQGRSAAIINKVE
jgi:hypothetical protein